MATSKRLKAISVGGEGNAVKRNPHSLLCGMLSDSACMENNMADPQKLED